MGRRYHDLSKSLMGRLLLVLILVVLSVTSVGGETEQQWRGVSAAVAEVHHVVGGDRGWDIASDIAAWAADRLFRVGDKIWFAYSAAGESIVELGSKEEMEACDVAKPIRMYTDGLDSITLDGVGSRFFASGRPDSCKKGLKLNVLVVPREQQTQMGMMKSLNPITIPVAVAAGPTTPSAAVAAAPPLSWLCLLFFFFIPFF